MDELKKVTWPDWPQLKNSTLVILVFCVIVAAIIALMDWSPAECWASSWACSQGEMSEDPRWYAIQTYSGHENKVKKLIEHRIAEEAGRYARGEGDPGGLVPTQDVVEIKNGKRVTVTRRLYPGYVLVKMLINQRTMHVVNNIQGVIKFVGGGAAAPAAA